MVYQIITIIYIIILFILMLLTFLELSQKVKNIIAKIIWSMSCSLVAIAIGYMFLKLCYIDPDSTRYISMKILVLFGGLIELFIFISAIFPWLIELDMTNAIDRFLDIKESH